MQVTIQHQHIKYIATKKNFKMKLLVLAVIFVVYISVVPEVDAEDPSLYSVPSSCKINVVGCPSNKADKECNKCCRRAGCNRGDCHTYNCKCKGCKG